MRMGTVSRMGFRSILLLGFGVGLASCSSSGGGASPGTAGTTGGSAAGTSGGAAGAGGGAAGHGGNAAGTGGGAAGTGGGAAGTGGGAAGTGGGGGAPWALTSTDVANGAAMPYQFTCNGHDFASGDNPELEWNAGPAGTMSYAIVLKDTSIISANDPTSAAYNRGFHWVIWDIPTTVPFKISHGMGDAEFPPEVPGARQWANRNQFGYFPPCPNNDPTSDAGRVTDHYSLTLYAINKAILDYPAMDPNVVNYTRTIDDYIETVAIAKTELQFTSDAASTSAPGPLGTIAYPSQRGAGGNDGGAGGAGGNDGGAGGTGGSGGGGAGGAGTAGASGAGGHDGGGGAG
jgi:phosphatidylethanolamine-binding protein (PEBP) family uncharacterized protein